MEGTKETQSFSVSKAWLPMVVSTVKMATKAKKREIGVAGTLCKTHATKECFSLLHIFCEIAIGVCPLIYSFYSLIINQNDTNTVP